MMAKKVLSGCVKAGAVEVRGLASRGAVLLGWQHFGLVKVCRKAGTLLVEASKIGEGDGSNGVPCQGAASPWHGANGM